MRYESYNSVVNRKIHASQGTRSSASLETGLTSPLHLLSPPSLHHRIDDPRRWTMAKRKLVKEPSEDDSDLSLAPEDLAAGAVALAEEQHEEQQPAKMRKTAAKPRAKKAKVEVIEEVETANITQSPPTAKRARKVKVEEQQPTEAAAEAGQKPTPKKRQSKTKAVKEEEAEVGETGEVIEKKVKRKRKTKEEKEAEAMPLAARTVGHKLFIGAHVSSAGGQCTCSSCITCTMAEVDHLHRRPQCSHEQRPHRRLRLRAIPQIAAQMGQSALAV